MSITKAKLEEFIGKEVSVTLFDGDTYVGKLRKTGTEELRNKDYTLFLTKDRYYVEFLKTDLVNHISHIFRCSYIKKIKVM